MKYSNKLKIYEDIIYINDRDTINIYINVLEQGKWHVLTNVRWLDITKNEFTDTTVLNFKVYNNIDIDEQIGTICIINNFYRKEIKVIRGNKQLNDNKFFVLDSIGGTIILNYNNSIQTSIKHDDGIISSLTRQNDKGEVYIKVLENDWSLEPLHASIEIINKDIHENINITQKETII